MATVRYTVVDGEVIAEKRNGVRSTYVPDPLGSTVALLDNMQAKTDTFSYWPYGEERARTGSTQTPLRFAGTAGYRREPNGHTYVRARYLLSPLARWSSSDPIGLESGIAIRYDVPLGLVLADEYRRPGSPYGYADNSPVTLRDPSGLKPLTSEQRRRVIQCAERWIGVAYRYGGASRAGVDCSHLVWLVYSEAGISYRYEPGVITWYGSGPVDAGASGAIHFG